MSQQPPSWTVTESPSLRNPMLAALKSNGPVNVAGGKKKAKEQDDILEKINDFHTALRTGLVPEYDKLETQLSDSMQDVSSRIEQLNGIRKEKRDLAELFFGKVSDNRDEIDAQLEKIRDWQHSERDISDLQNRMTKARHDLDIHKEKLAQLAEETEAFENATLEKEQRTRAMLRVIVLCALVVISAVFTRDHYLSRTKNSD